MLSTCLHSGFGNENCIHSEDVAVTCSSAGKCMIIIRLMDSQCKLRNYTDVGRMRDPKSWQGWIQGLLREVGANKN